MRTPQDLTAAIEITDSHIKLIQIKTGREGKAISGVDIRPINGAADAEITNTIEEMLSARELSARDCVVTIPRRLAILKQLTLPSRIHTEIAQMIEMQVARNIPYSPEDIIYDYTILKKDLSSAAVLVAIVSREVIQRYLDIFKAAGALPGWLTLSSSGIAGWLEYRAQKGRPEFKSSLCFINIDAVHAEICFCNDQKLTFSRQVPFGIADIRGGRISAFEQQLALTLEAYRKEQMGADISRCVIISTLPEAVFLKDDIEREYKVSVAILSSFEDFPCGEEVEVRDTWLQSECSIAVGLGLLFSEKKRWLNLMPPEIRNTSVARQRQRQWAKLVLAAAVTFVSVSTVFGYEIYSRAKYLSQVQNEIVQIEPELKKARNEAKLLRLVGEKSAERIFIAEVIKELQQLLPSEVHFYALSVSGGGVLNVQGYAKTGESVSQLQNDLVRSPFFRNVTLQYATLRKSSSGELTDFKMSCQFVQVKEGKKNEIALK
jgi:Tfp pilus assembly PilM family ATPase/Tfp pilus assembly protein PilN